MDWLLNFLQINQKSPEYSPVRSLYNFCELAANHSVVITGENPKHTYKIYRHRSRHMPVILKIWRWQKCDTAPLTTTSGTNQTCQKEYPQSAFLSWNQSEKMLLFTRQLASKKPML